MYKQSVAKLLFKNWLAKNIPKMRNAFFQLFDTLGLAVKDQVKRSEQNNQNLLNFNH